MGRGHDRKEKERVRELERNPFADPIFADEMEGYDDPPTVNGHKPDYMYENTFGQLIVGEVERQGDDSAHTRSQRQAFEAFDARGPAFENETVFYDEEEDESGLLSNLLGL